jgi:Fur family peroxide stress response transcriptional regulator
MVPRLEQVLEKLKTTGVRMTPQRHAILSYLLDTDAHPTADEIYRALEPKFPSMSVATIYNNLKRFGEAGLVKEMTFGDGSSRFDADMSDHYHAHCKACGKITDFHYPPLAGVHSSAAAQTGFYVEGYRLEVYGVCQACSDAGVRG